MIYDLCERETETLKNMNEIKERCEVILRDIKRGQYGFIEDDLKDIQTYLNFIAEDLFNRKENEW